jgi:thiamine pyrophosphokinase
MNQTHIDFWLKEFEHFTTAIVANGEVPSSELSIRLLREMKRVICCDGALQKLLSINIIPDVVVGDGDSMEGELLPENKSMIPAVETCRGASLQNDNPPCRDVVHRVSTNDREIPYYPDKSEEYNDLQKALKYCTANGYDNILLLGCGGLREDHFIANLSILAMYSKEMHLTMLTEHGVFNVLRCKSTFRSLPGMQVSVFARSPHTKLTFTGLKYPVNDRSFKWLWEGSLNEAAGEEFIVEASDDEPVVVYRAL